MNDDLSPTGHNPLSQTVRSFAQDTEIDYECIDERDQVFLTTAHYGGHWVCFEFRKPLGGHPTSRNTVSALWALASESRRRPAGSGDDLMDPEKWQIGQDALLMFGEGFGRTAYEMGMIRKEFGWRKRHGRGDKIEIVYIPKYDERLTGNHNSHPSHPKLISSQEVI